MKRFAKAAAMGVAVSSLLAVLPLAAQTVPAAGAAFDADGSGTEVSDFFNAVRGESVESKSSAGLFSSDVDDFIGVNDYNRDIGTFFYVGGGNDAAAKPYASLGFAKSFKFGYLGAYYDGQLVDGTSTNDGDDEAVVTGNATWNNYFALIFGNDALGALRLDLIIDAENDSETTDGKQSGNSTNKGVGTTALALTWGKNIGKLSPHATVGFQFPDYDVTSINADDEKSITWGGSTPAALFFKAGTGISLDDTSSINVDLILGFDLGKTVDDQITGTKSTTAGPFYFQVPFSYSKTLAFGETGLALKLKPNARIGIKVEDPNVSGDTTVDTNSDIYFGLQTGVKAGIQYNLPGKMSKFALYTGINFQLFDWETLTHAKGADGAEDKSSAGHFYGPAFNPGSTLDIGVTWKPTDNLTIGITGLLENFFEMDAGTMQLTGGNWDLSTPFSGFTLDLTVSFKF